GRKGESLLTRKREGRESAKGTGQTRRSLQFGRSLSNGIRVLRSLRVFAQKEFRAFADFRAFAVRPAPFRLAVSHFGPQRGPRPCPASRRRGPCARGRRSEAACRRWSGRPAGSAASRVCRRSWVSSSPSR